MTEYAELCGCLMEIQDLIETYLAIMTGCVILITIFQVIKFFGK